MTKSENALAQLAAMGVTVVQLPGISRRCIADADGLLALGPHQSEAELWQTLAHEAEHYRLQAFYRPDAPLALRLGAEKAVSNRAVRQTVPRRALRAMLRRGLPLWQVAQALGVPQDEVEQAIGRYRASCGYF